MTGYALVCGRLMKRSSLDGRGDAIERRDVLAALLRDARVAPHSHKRRFPELQPREKNSRS